MPKATWLLTFFLFACSDIAPVDTIDLCQGNDPPSDSCGQCKTAPFAAECPKCRGSHPDAECANAAGRADGGGSGGKSGSSGSSGNGGSSGTNVAGTGGMDAMVQDGGAGASGAGGTGGSGGTGGAGACGTRCSDSKPQCFDGACVECIEGRDCTTATPQCNPADHTCVECLTDDECKSQSKVCDEPSHTCVECEIDKDCKDTTAPQCKNNACKSCTDQTACEGRKGTLHCDTGSASATKGECVECVAHANCKNPTPQCNVARKCVACGADAACTDRGTTPVCDTDSWSDSKGTCVECTGTKYGACKDGSTEYVCDSAARKCSTSHKKGETTACTSCVSDAECLAGLGCAQEAFGQSTSYCFLIDGPSTACADDVNSLARPFSQSTPLASIEHASVDYCLPKTTCQAYLDAAAQKSCLTNTTPDSTKCGEGADDGHCLGSGTGAGKCSYSCDEVFDCPSTGFTSCSGTGSTYCQPP